MRTLLPLFFLLLFPSTIFSQEKTGKFSGSLLASYSLPTGEFKSIYGKGALGANLSVMSRPTKKLPFSLGLELGYHNMEADAYYHATGSTSYEKFASTNFVSVFPKLRIQHPKNIAFSPFAEALLGANFFYAHEKIITNSYVWGESKERKIRDLSAKPGFGLAAGFNIPISKTGEKLEVKSIYMLSGRTRYYGDPSYTSGGELTFNELRSRTDMLMFQVGINL